MTSTGSGDIITKPPVREVSGLSSTTDASISAGMESTAVPEALSTSTTAPTTVSPEGNTTSIPCRPLTACAVVMTKWPGVSATAVAGSELAASDAPTSIVGIGGPLGTGSGAVVVSGVLVSTGTAESTGVATSRIVVALSTADTPAAL